MAKTARLPLGHGHRDERLQMHRVREGEKELDCVRVQDSKLPQAGMQRYEGRAARLQPFERPGGDHDMRQHEHDGLLALWMARSHRLSLL